jgi:hypothetical protein
MSSESLPLPGGEGTGKNPLRPRRPDLTTTAAPRPLALASREAWFARLLIVGLGLLHGLAIWIGMGGRDGLKSPWPLARHDHPLYFHSAVITRAFLVRTGTTAGYDPSFMAGYAKSVVFPASSTLPEVILALAGASRAVLAYKLYVLGSAALVPWLLAGAGGLGRMRAGAVATSVLLFLTYVWTDFPIQYATFGMLPYFLAIPLGLAVTLALARFLERGGPWWWLGAAAGAAAVVLVHLTAAMVVAPAAALAYVVAVVTARRAGRAFPVSRHAGVWAIPVVVLAVNAFWWLPGIWLAGTKGESGFAFAHPEPVGGRLLQILTREPPIQAVLWVLGAAGLVVLARRDRIAAAGLAGFIAAGFFWGYLAGAFRALDFLQPGRHTYAFYSGGALAAGVGLAELLDRLRARGRWLAGAAAVGATLGAGWLFSPGLVGSYRALLAGPVPFLSSRPPPHLRWVVDRVRRHVRPGQRLLYEEGGFGLPGLPDPFAGGRYSGLLPHLAGVEVLGGPYLHAALTTNFTQFGEGKLFGQARWGRAAFVRYARLYRPAAIVCWTPWARAFCRAQPDLVEVLDDDGVVLIGRVNGFGGPTIRGTAVVRAEPGRLWVRTGAPGLDGRIVLRYHSVPCLRSRPPGRLESLRLEDDPVPFIAVGPHPEPLILELDVPPR